MSAYLADETRRPMGMTVTVNWKDQGWGNRKGHLFLCYKGMQQRITPVSADHTWKTYTIYPGQGRFQEWAEQAKLGDDKDALYFFYSVGGGGGHELYVQSLKVEMSFEAIPEV